MTIANVVVDQAFVDGVNLMQEHLSSLDSPSLVSEQVVAEASRDMLISAYLGNDQAMFTLYCLAKRQMVKLDAVKWLYAAYVHGHEKAKRIISEMKISDDVAIAYANWATGLGVFEPAVVHHEG